MEEFGTFLDTHGRATETSPLICPLSLSQVQLKGDEEQSVFVSHVGAGAVPVVLTILPLSLTVTTLFPPQSSLSQVQLKGGEEQSVCVSPMG